MIASSFIEAYIQDSDTFPRNHRIYISFILLWTLFEAWITDLENDKNVTSVIQKHFQGIEPLFKKSWARLAIQNWVGSLQIIKSVCPIVDKTGRSRGSYDIDISDLNNINLGKLSLVLFRIRSNLIHGSENVRDNENVKLFTACRDILAPWLKQTS